MLFWPLVVITALLLAYFTVADDARQYKADGWYEKTNDDYYSTKTKVHENPWKKEFTGALTIWFFVSLVVYGIIYCVLSSIIGAHIAQKSDYSYRYNIYALEDSVTTTFVVRRHYQTDDSSGIRFYHIYKTGDGGKKVGWVNQNHATLYDTLTSNEQPYIDVYLTNKDFDNASLVQKLFIFKWMASDEEKDYKIHVPQGTIGNDYNVDLE